MSKWEDALDRFIERTSFPELVKPCAQPKGKLSKEDREFDRSVVELCGLMFVAFFSPPLFLVLMMQRTRPLL